MSNDTKRVWAYTRVDRTLIKDDNTTALLMLPVVAYPTREAAQRAADADWREAYDLEDKIILGGCGCAFEPLKWREPSRYSGWIWAVLDMEDPEGDPREDAADAYVVYPIEVAE